MEKIWKFTKILDYGKTTSTKIPFCLGFLWFKEVDFLLFWFEWLHEWRETISIDFKAVIAIGIQ